MELIRHKIITGFPCNDNLYCIMTEDYGQLFTENKDQFDKVVADGFIELEHNTIEDCI